jgi:hypothetical protein
MQSTELTSNADPPVNLSECWGDEFVALYNKYEASGKARKTIKAQELWFAVIEAQTETGTPYLLYKDACNSKSNQQVFFFDAACNRIQHTTHQQSGQDWIRVCDVIVY